MNTNTTTTIEQAGEKIAAEMLTFYKGDIDGVIGELEGDDLQNAIDSSEQAKQTAIAIFAPVIKDLHQQLLEQAEIIEALEAKLAQAQAERTEAKKPVPANIEITDIPTLEWVITSHKNKKNDAKLNGYHVYCMKFLSLRGRFPPKGWWEYQDQEAWNNLAAAYVSHRQAAKPTTQASIMAAAVAATEPVPMPQFDVALLKSKARAPYNLYVSWWKAQPENKNKNFPPANSWKNLPATEKAAFEAKFAQLKEARASIRA